MTMLSFRCRLDRHNRGWMMKIGIAAAMLLVGAFGSAAQARGGGHSSGGYHTSSSGYHADHVVSGYTRSNGTYVHSYHATNANGTRNDNYSTRGNVNPYTGAEGTKPRDGETPN